jgi:hypothetical protein
MLDTYFILHTHRVRILNSGFFLILPFLSIIAVYFIYCHETFYLGNQLLLQCTVIILSSLIMMKLHVSHSWKEAHGLQ